MPAIRTLEVPVDSVEAARLAAPLASRLEVCSDLSTEGWTPTPDLLKACREAAEGTACTVVAMIRPRFAGCRHELDVQAFATTSNLLDLCLRGIEMAARSGAHSVAMSLLTPDGFVDQKANARLVAQATDHGLIPAFLRTFDLLSDRARGVRDLSQLGFVRFVTAGVLGWDATVSPLDERIALVRQDVENAKREARLLGREPIEVVPGGGVRAANAQRWLHASPHLHASCRRDGVFSVEELKSLAAKLLS